MAVLAGVVSDCFDILLDQSSFFPTGMYIVYGFTNQYNVIHCCAVENKSNKKLLSCY